MSMSYGPLAEGYDALTGDVPYDSLADWYETALSRGDRAVHTVLDLGCGTGSLSLLLAERGYEVVSADPSPEMLCVFQNKLWELPENVIRPMLLCQGGENLDLNDTVDGAVSSLDAFNYMSPDLLPEVFRRLRLFISPGGCLCFDILAPEWLRSLDGQCFVDEREDLLCLWRASLEGAQLRYGMDIFRRSGRNLWRREQEEHTEYIHEPEMLLRMMEENGFGRMEVRRDGPQCEKGRLFLSAVRL